MFSFLDTTDPVVILYNIFLIAIVPAVGEELLFRGGIQNLLIRWLKNPHVAIIATAILFSAMHMQFLTFLPRFVLGLVLGYLMVYGRSIWYSIIGHFTNNFLSLVVFHYYRITKPDVNPLDPSQVGDSQPLLGWAGLVVVLALLYYFRQHVKARSEAPVMN
jgi:membrane protease YdiL (CAAX protease family)